MRFRFCAGCQKSALNFALHYFAKNQLQFMAIYPNNNNLEVIFMLATIRTDENIWANFILLGRQKR